MARWKAHHLRLVSVDGDAVSSSGERSMPRSLAKRKVHKCHFAGIPLRQLRTVEGGRPDAAATTATPPKRSMMFNMKGVYPFYGQFANPKNGQIAKRHLSLQNTGMIKSPPQRKRLRKPVAGAPSNPVQYKHDLSLRMRQIREALNFSQEAMAARLGVPLSTYLKYENKTSALAFDRMPVLVSLGVNLHFYFCGHAPILQESNDSLTPSLVEQDQKTG